MTIYLSENLKNLRRGKDITQEKLAEYLGVTFQSVSNWERGESYPDITMLPEIASFFGVSTDELLGVGRVDEEELLRLLEDYDNLQWDVENKKKALKRELFAILVRIFSAFLTVNSLTENGYL